MSPADGAHAAGTPGEVVRSILDASTGEIASKGLVTGRLRPCTPDMVASARPYG
jgi:hypothetical protein